mmetsp:Transcript_12335/g.16030  ORF Transcript_12335/g.16030 Transcript_12335/m.16030 type:complete len:612 (+) Transcript_12335:28-1863(+)
MSVNIYKSAFGAGIGRGMRFLRHFHGLSNNFYLARSVNQNISPYSYSCREKLFSTAIGNSSEKTVTLNDSLTGKTVDLATALNREPANVLTMYVCGPTVYDAAHLGHARTYVQFDTIRRILQDLCGYKVAFFMNITDVDDKIVNRASEKGMDFKDLALEHETSFFRDMELLGVEKPLFSPRCTDYMDEIVSFISRLEDSGLTYHGPETGSVYFDTAKMESSGLSYGDLGTMNRGKALEEHESVYMENSEIDEGIQGDKRSARDFALWKIKDAQPCWPSPWGLGRPGWHSECSAMIDATAGTLRSDGCLDIHGGGIDLRFPHHENERAQSQSLVCDSCKNWTSIFLHTGHLHIRGRKMSKSLKNFLTIEMALEGGDDYDFPVMSPRQLRLLFLSQRYSAPMEFTTEAVQETLALDKQFSEFFANTRIVLSQNGEDYNDHKICNKWTKIDATFVGVISQGEEQIDIALRNDFDIPRALAQLRKVVKETNVYVNENESHPKLGAVRQACQLVSKYLSILGIGGGVSPFKCAVNGYDATLTFTNQSQARGEEIEVSQLLDILTQFRADVRNSLRSENPKGEIFKLCDKLRDEDLMRLNVHLEDRKGRSIWKKNNK